MKTDFTEAQLRDPDMARSNEVLRACVHCGFCTATCPTYVVLGDELDSPRGRIYLIKEMLENDRPADARTVRHIDRCLSCLACMTTCPSGVHYQHLVDHARAHIAKTYRRPPFERALRWTLARILPFPGRFRAAMWAARLGRPFAGLMPDARLGAMLRMAPRSLPRRSAMAAPQVHPAEGARRMRVALLTGCAQQVLDPAINDATIRLLTRLGAEVVVTQDQGCCGALVHHMGAVKDGHAQAARNVRAWMAEVRGAGLDAIVVNTSGCGTTVKDYGHMLRTDPGLAEDAATVSALARDVAEVLVDLMPAEDHRQANPAKLGVAGIDAPAEDRGHPIPDDAHRGRRVAYHAACSLQHGQKVRGGPKDLLRAVGFKVVEPADPHLCCGSAGVYNLLQPAIAGELQARKVATLEETGAEVIAAGNIGCMVQIGAKAGMPVVHTVELIDWATGGPVPPGLAGRLERRQDDGHIAATAAE